MPALRKYTDEQINKALDMYQNTNKTLKEICKETGLDKNRINYYVDKNNIPKRNPQKDPYSRICQFCRRKIALVDIQYCPYCGKDIREREDILKFDAKRLYQYQQYLPSADRDSYKKIVDRIVGYFNEKTRKNII